MPSVVSTFIRAALRAGRPITDAEFDRVFPAAHRYRSSVHWTPVEVALRVGALLAPAPGGRVLDVGAGVGKACLLGALTTRLAWDGIERDARMVRTARMAARALGVAEQARFLEGDVASVDWSAYGGLYLYNPFAEALWAEQARLDEVQVPTYQADVAAAARKLAEVAVGTLVVTFHGFGGELPPGFVERRRESFHRGELSLWERVRA
ncbi:MAG: hypothetical protein R2939_07445 [Kofleriaceae bacterium]